MNELEYRTAAPLQVRHAERTIDLIAVPYDEPADVERRGRLVVESIAPGAFAGVHGDVTVRRTHDPERPLGMVRRFYPNDPRGLRAELRISRTAEGDEVLELADDGLLAASVGYYVLPGGEEWSTDRQTVKVTRAQLDHIALTGAPAYQGARVLAVRSQDPTPPRSPTPNLDALRLEVLTEQFGTWRR